MPDIITIDPRTLSIPERHGYLLSAVAPRPIAFASTIDKEGNVNLSPFSFFNVFSSNPPVMIFSPARSGKDRSHKHTYLNVKEVPEVVINIVNYPMVEQMSLASTMYDRGVNEFIKAGFTQISSKKVKPPRVAEAPVSFECVVDQVIELGDEGASGNLVIVRVVLIHIQSQYLDESGKLDTQKLDLVGRMGEIWYTHASGDALFEIPRPGKPVGIGIDQLPAHIRNSSVLTGNNLGRLGNLPQLPTEAELTEIKNKPEIQAILNIDAVEKRQNMLHLFAQKYLENNQVEMAMKVLMSDEG